jgi:hypothetical protein
MDSVKNAIALDGTIWSGEGGDGVRYVKLKYILLFFVIFL